jgi:hypothetical protein
MEPHIDFSLSLSLPHPLRGRELLKKIAIKISLNLLRAACKTATKKHEYGMMRAAKQHIPNAIRIK